MNRRNFTKEIILAAGAIAIAIPVIKILDNNYDADSIAYFKAVIAKGGQLTRKKKIAINQIVIDFKNMNLWDSLFSFYPMMDSNGMLVNLKNPKI